MSDEELIKELWDSGNREASDRLLELSQTVLKARLAGMKSLRHATIYKGPAWPVYEALGFQERQCN